MKKADISTNDDQLNSAERNAQRVVQARQRAFLAASSKGDLPAQIQIAREQAREMLMTSGLDDEEELNHAAALAGVQSGAAGDWESVCHHLKAVYALGIAIGQLVHPDMFTPNKKAGTR
jgi:hypothetical protein